MVRYRIAQEQVTNIAGYAEASLVAVTLHKERDAIQLVINDNGKGFDPSKKLAV